MIAAIPPLAEDAASVAWSVRSLGELVERLRSRHPDCTLRDVRRAAIAALFVDDREAEIDGLRRSLRSAYARIADLQRELAGLRGKALDLWLGLEAEKHGDPE